MNLTQEQLDYIELDLRMKGVVVEDLLESVLDHICCFIEENKQDNFYEAYQLAITKFKEDELEQMQDEIVNYNNYIKMKKSKRLLYSLGFISFFIISTGILFKVMHWPGAGYSLLLGVLFLNFGFLPMYFYDRYKQAISN